MIFMIIQNILKQLNLPLGHTITHIFADEDILLKFEDTHESNNNLFILN